MNSTQHDHEQKIDSTPDQNPDVQPPIHQPSTTQPTINQTPTQPGQQHQSTPPGKDVPKKDFQPESEESKKKSQQEMDNQQQISQQKRQQQQQQKQQGTADVIKGKWQQQVGAAKKMWGKLTDDEIMQSNGDADKLAGLVKERYAVNRIEADKQVKKFLAESNY
jgi:uncharacterized protein YjbJ (UPF0337 family)